MSSRVRVHTHLQRRVFTNRIVLGLMDASIKTPCAGIMCSRSYLDKQLISFNTEKQKEYGM